MIQVAYLVHLAFSIYTFGLFIYGILSWFPDLKTAAPAVERVYRWIERLYLPVLTQIRSFVKPLPFNGKNIDLSLLILFAALYLLRMIIISILLPGF